MKKINQYNLPLKKSIKEEKTHDHLNRCEKKAFAGIYHLFMVKLSKLGIGMSYLAEADENHLHESHG